MEDSDARSVGTNESELRSRLKSAVDENKKDAKILNKTELLFKKMKSKILREVQKEEEAKEWERYLNCNQLPYPQLPSSVHLHFVAWCQKSKFATLQQLDTSLTLYLPLFDTIKLLTDFPVKMKLNILKGLREIMQNWKCEFTEKIDYACFTMIKEIRKYFSSINYYQRNYENSFENFEIGMWTLLDVPFSSICKFNRHKLHFPNINATVTLPLSYNSKPIVLRVMYTPFDFLSDLTVSRFQPEITSNDLINELKRCENLMESQDLVAIQKENEMVIKNTKQVTLSERQLSFLKNYRSNTPSSFIHSQESKSIHSTNNFFQHKIKLMKMHAKDIRNGTSFNHFDKLRGMHSPWEGRHMAGYRSSGESLVSSLTTCTAKSSIINRIFSFGSSLIDPFSHEEIETEDKGGKQSEWTNSYWESLDVGDIDLDDNTSFLDLIFLFEESNTYMSLVGLLKEDSLSRKEPTASKDISSAINKLIKNEDDRYKQLVQEMTIKLNPKEVNLRCYHSFSGVYHVDLIKHLSNICHLKIGNFLQIHTDGSYQLQKENFLCDIQDINGSDTNDTFIMNCEYYFESNEPIETNIDEHRQSSVSSILSAKKRKTSETINEQVKKQSETTNEQFRKQSETINEQFRKQSETINEQFRKQSETINEQFRKQSETINEQVKKQSETINEQVKKQIETINGQVKNQSDTIIEQVKKQPITEFHNSDKLVVLKVPLSSKVYWFMKPQPAVWDNNKKCWSVEHVCDIEHDREQNMLEFKLGKLGPIAMFTFRFHELPYKNWSLSPDEDQEVVLVLEGQHLTIHLKIINDKVCLKRIDGISEHQLEGIIGKPVLITELITKLKSVGLDIFPEIDSFLYVKQCSAKPLALEDHTYYTMAIFSNILEFKASSWNLAFRHKDILFQFRLNTYHKTNPFQTLLCSNLGCDVLMIEDEADIYVDITNKIIGHYPGPFSLFSKIFRNKIDLLPEDLPKIDAVYNILKKTKILTYSGNPAKFL